MNVLIVSYEAWRDTNNGGNVLSNLFSAFPDARIAQIYCSGELPQNAICQKYFQISESMLLTAQKGRVLEERSYAQAPTDQQELIENKMKSRIPFFLRELALLTRECVWSLSNWQTGELERFVKDFQPDVIFAPCYSYFHVSKLALHVKRLAGCPMISYISDDNYSLKQIRFAPSFWINRLITRKWIRRLFAECAFVYTMTELQKREYEALLKRPMKVLCKSAAFLNRTKEVGHPIQFIYAGGLYLNRWKVLARLTDALREINRDGIKAELHIYSGSELTARQRRRLEGPKSTFLHGTIPYEELEARYRASDVAVHVESFDKKNSLITRLSFSTKIIDCMNSGCAILAIGPDTQAGIAYLKENDAAVCIGRVDAILPTVHELIDDPDKIEFYAERAQALGKRNHQKEAIEKSIRQDFYRVASGILKEKTDSE